MCKHGFIIIIFFFIDGNRSKCRAPKNYGRNRVVKQSVRGRLKVLGSVPSSPPPSVRVRRACVERGSRITYIYECVIKITHTHTIPLVWTFIYTYKLSMFTMRLFCLFFLSLFLVFKKLLFTLPPITSNEYTRLLIRLQYAYTFSAETTTGGVFILDL